MRSGFRKFLAISEVVGGLAVLALPVVLSMQGFTIAWWYWLLVWSFGGAAVAAGVWLWRDEPRGRTLSALIQALQIVQFQTSTFGISALAGLQLRLLVTDAEFNVGPAFHGSLTFTMGQGMPWSITINFFSLYALYALLRSPHAQERDRTKPEDARTVASPDAHNGADAVAGEAVP
jgi:hypothetical protein